MAKISPELGAFLAQILASYNELQRAKQRTLDAVLADFEPDPTGAVGRNVVHEAVAKRFNRAVSNELVIEVQAAIALIGGVLPVTRCGNAIYRGLKPRA